jgi:hypothetical protein
MATLVERAERSRTGSGRTLTGSSLASNDHANFSAYNPAGQGLLEISRLRQGVRA